MADTVTPRFTVTEGRSQKMTFSGTTDSVAVTWHQDYFVEVGGVGVNPADVTAYQVLQATGIPTVNRSVYYAGNKIIPFVVCRDKTAEQIPNRISRWKVSTQWSAKTKHNQEESANEPIDPPDAVTDITPSVVSTLGEKERVLFEDKQSTPARYMLPTGNYFSEPLIERVPTLTLKITQYESTITYEQMLARKFRCNEGTYRSQPRYDWLIEDVEATEVDVTLSGGVTTAALVTYTVTHSPDLYGWKHDVALVDTHYLDSGDSDKKKPFPDDVLQTSAVGLLEVTGYPKADQTDDPTHLQFEPYETIDFDTFLQV